MTVRLSALFESLWSRAPAPAPRRARRTRPPRRQRRVTRTESMNGHSGSGSPPPPPRASSSSSEPLAATSRRVHARPAPDSDSDAPLTHAKGKGVGKKSKSSSNSAEPVPGPSSHHAPYTETNGLASDSEGSALLEGSPLHDSDDERLHTPRERSGSGARRRGRKRVRSGSGAWTRPKRRARHQDRTPNRRRERFTSGSSSSSSSSSSGSGSGARRYESDRSYRPRYSTDDDAPLHLYRQRQGAPHAAGPSRRALNGHARGGVSLRARLSPGRYNEDSESDSVLAISKRAQHAPRPRAHQRLEGRAGVPYADHNYFTGRERSPAPAAPNQPDHEHPRTEPAGPVSISSRGRVRRLTPKGQGLYTRKHH